MLSSGVLGTLSVAVLAVAWVAVQRAWARSFPDAFDDPDVLAGRGAGCGSCGCTTACSRRAQEETS